MPRFPEWLEPMAATLTEERFSGPELRHPRLIGVRHDKSAREVARESR